MTRRVQLPLGDEFATDDLAYFGTTSGTVTKEADTGPYGQDCLVVEPESFYVITLPASYGRFFVGVHIRFTNVVSGSGEGEIRFLEFLDAATEQCHLRLSTSAATRTIGLYRGTTLLGSASVSTVSEDTWYHLSVDMQIADSATAANLVIRVAELSDVQNNYVTFVSNQDTKTTSNATMNAVKFSAGGSKLRMRFANFIFQDDAGSVFNSALEERVVAVVRPSGNGAQSDFVGSDADSTDNYLLVDEADISEADYVESGSVGAQDLYTHGAIGAFQVETVCVHSIAAKTQPGVREFSHLLNSGANTGVGPSTALTVEPTHYATIFELEPDSSASWTPTLFDATESGYEVTV
jgi:hypothetical protein